MPSVAVRRVEAAALETRPIGPRVLLIDNQERISRDLGAALPAAGYAVHQVPMEKRLYGALRPSGPI